MSERRARDVPEVKYPRHILCVGAPDSGVLALLKELTGSAPNPRTIEDAGTSPGDSVHDQELANDAADESLNTAAGDSRNRSQTTTAGLGHELHLSTKYYRATIPIWIDETSDPSAWGSDFQSSDASDVIKAVGAWVVVFRKTNAGWETARELMSAVKDAVAAAYGGDDVWDGCFLCVGMLAERDAVEKAENSLGTGYEEWEDEVFDLGFEFVDGEINRNDGKTRDAAGELRGVARLIEAFEANEWENVDDINDSILSLDEDSADAGSLLGKGAVADETTGFRLERAQMEREFAGLSMAMADEGAKHEDEAADEKQQVEELERMMLRMQAAKDMSAHLPEQERKRLAKKTVDDIMREM